MGNLVTVTLETDGLRDFVRLPTGERYNLGPVSVLKLVSSLVPDRRKKRLALDEFLRTGRAVTCLDPEAMFQLLAPKLVRRAAVGSSLIYPPDWTLSTSMEGKNMSDLKRALEVRLSHIEKAVHEMNNRAANGQTIPEGWHQNVRRASVSLTDFGDQSKNKAFYGLGEPKVDTVEDGGWMPPADVTHPMGKSAAALKSNADLAEDILVKVAETSDKVEALKTAGRRFNASKAQADLHKLATQVHDILSNVDLAEGWVQNDLNEIAKQASHLHGLFASARV